MDINCTQQCRHQRDGKCILNDVPKVQHHSFSSHHSYGSDCIYFEVPYRDGGSVIPFGGEWINS